MNFYKLNESLRTLSDKLIEAGDCAEHPLSLYSKYHKNLDAEGLTIPNENEFELTKDCTYWHPITKRAAQYLLGIRRLKDREINPERYLPYDIKIIKSENYHPASGLYSGIMRLIQNDRSANNWWSLFPDWAHGEMKQISFSVAKMFLEKFKDGNLGKNAEIMNIDGHDMVIPNEYLSSIMLNQVQEVFPSPKQSWNIGENKSLTEASNNQDEIAELIARQAYIKMPQIFRRFGDEYVMSVIDDIAELYADQTDNVDSNDINAMLNKLTNRLELASDNDNNEQLALEGAATVFSDAKGHHLKNADGKVVQSFEKTPEGLRQARNALYVNYNALSVEQPKEGAMNEYEEKYNAALNESLTINTTAGTDQSDTVNVTATDEDAHTLVAILKAAGLPYKDREAQLVATTPCGGTVSVEEEYANEPNDASDLDSVGDIDLITNKLSGGLNRVKNQYRPAASGDNPMAIKEDELMRGLWNLYGEYK